MTHRVRSVFAPFEGLLVPVLVVVLLLPAGLRGSAEAQMTTPGSAGVGAEPGPERAAGFEREAAPERVGLHGAIPDLAVLHRAVRDTIIVDTILPDTIQPPRVPDPFRRQDDPGAAVTDTLLGTAERDPDDPGPGMDGPVRNRPQARPVMPSRPEAGVWEWDREGLANTHAITLHDLVSHVPGITLVRGGDMGNPVAPVAFGLGPGQIRIFRDGVEDPPMEGGVVDLSDLGLSGLESVRVERRPGELRIHLESVRVTDPRPYTYLDLATGDLRTNIFRATFVHPDALGGTVLLALDRTDTDGWRREEPSAAYGTHLRYTLFPGEDEDLGIALQYRSRTSQRADGIFEPVEVERTDWGVEAGWRVREDVVLEAFGNRTRTRTGDAAASQADTLLPGFARSQMGLRLSGDRGPITARTEVRRQDGAGWPRWVAAGEVGGDWSGWGGASLATEQEFWDGDERGRSFSARVWTEPRFGLSAFAEVQDLERGAPSLPPLAEGDEESEPGNGDGNGNGDGGEPDLEPGDLLRVDSRQGLRVGARGQWRGLDVTAAWLSVDADSLRPMGLPWDREGVVRPGGQRTGVEVDAFVPLSPLLEGLGLRGQVQLWDAVAEPWRYMPDRSWTGAFQWHREGFDTSFEVWADVGVRGRDGMAVPLLVDGSDPATGPLQVVPNYQSWYGRLQFRVVSVRIFVHWENFTVREEQQDIPGRILPETRAVYGIRWTLWN
ncbi:MAG: Plug domain-containing protein [Gemmatimonadales bacterium]|nr:MAG: Plug domain-containing protein [Gemmatimonadales bacterium]